MANSAVAFHPKASSSSLKHKKRRWTREQLLKGLQLIGDLGTPLPSTLPPSPPASRAASPVVGLKRKIDSSTDLDSVKRPRIDPPVVRTPSQRHPPSISDLSHSSHTHLSSHRLPIQSDNQRSSALSQVISRSEPEDGEVREDVPSVVPVPPGIIGPIQRPKKGKASLRECDALYDKYHQAGRILKYSGDARFWSSYPPGHKEFRPLPDPPRPGTHYHTNGGLIACLELLDALVCFTYSIWNKEYCRKTCISQTWSTIDPFIAWCKQKWLPFKESRHNEEKALLGLVYMIEAFIRGRMMYYSVHPLDAEMDKAFEGARKRIAAVATGVVEGDPVLASNYGINSINSNGSTGTQLPSPASQNSTPANRGEGTPSNNQAIAPNPQAASHIDSASRESQYTGAVPFKLLPSYLRDSAHAIPAHLMTAITNVSEPINPTTIQGLKELTRNCKSSAKAYKEAQEYLTLPILRDSFPSTWARMMYSTLSPGDEHEPDLEDDEGELYWPDQCMNGDGIGWVCLMGRAMIKEYGKKKGYMGLDGVVPKPKPEETPPALPPPSYQQNHGQRSGPPPAYTPLAPSQRTMVNPSGAPR